MDEEQTAGYREPCAVCSAVDWGVSDEGRFYCRSCHNVIERTREVVDPTFTLGSARISTIGRGTRTKRPARGRQWVVCEGFQFILRNQADALLSLGVSPRFKRAPGSDSDSAAEASVLSASETDADTNASSAAGSTAGSSSDWSPCSGSLDAAHYLTDRLRRSRHALMSMKKTLALIHLALVWTGEPLTLSDLLRLVNEGHVPYLNAYEELPDEMRLEGKDALIFRVEVRINTESILDQSNAAGDHNASRGVFSLRRWFRVVQAGLAKAQQRRDHHVAR
ncbi:TATA box-binding protein-associated factor RNA polymerase I subunit B [Liparis tanakae]|uniref:TATA box-binding protein-associated factor RNA polymerase I subunit B n=1 Tax=Liparis tanakae TaxID=230148 RepID=A0A4Z2F5E0_9TELE|nr:TATA box-binding protein-associated factor RNA polymerase I subunit B [Liparis tanakae]